MFCNASPWNKDELGVARAVSSTFCGRKRCKHCAIRGCYLQLYVLICAKFLLTDCFSIKLLKLCCFSAVHWVSFFSTVRSRASTSVGTLFCTYLANVEPNLADTAHWAMIPAVVRSRLALPPGASQLQTPVWYPTQTYASKRLSFHLLWLCILHAHVVVVKSEG